MKNICFLCFCLLNTALSYGRHIKKSSYYITLNNDTVYCTLYTHNVYNTQKRITAIDSDFNIKALTPDEIKGFYLYGEDAKWLFVIDDTIDYIKDKQHKMLTKYAVPFSKSIEHKFYHSDSSRGYSFESKTLENGDHFFLQKECETGTLKYLAYYYPVENTNKHKTYEITLAAVYMLENNLQPIILKSNTKRKLCSIISDDTSLCAMVQHRKLNNFLHGADGAQIMDEYLRWKISAISGRRYKSDFLRGVLAGDNAPIHNGSYWIGCCSMAGFIMASMSEKGHSEILHYNVDNDLKELDYNSNALYIEGYELRKGYRGKRIYTVGQLTGFVLGTGMVYVIFYRLNKSRA